MNAAAWLAGGVGLLGAMALVWAVSVELALLVWRMRRWTVQRAGEDQ
ncbi:hypothetical protein [Streptomyces sp. NPDC002537]